MVKLVNQTAFSAKIKGEKLTKIKDGIIADAKQINFKAELCPFLPVDQQGIIRDLEHELNRLVA